MSRLQYQECAISCLGLPACRTRAGLAEWGGQHGYSNAKSRLRPALLGPGTTSHHERQIIFRIVAIALVVGDALERRDDLADRGYHGLPFTTSTPLVQIHDSICGPTTRSPMSHAGRSARSMAFATCIWAAILTSSCSSGCKPRTMQDVSCDIQRRAHPNHADDLEPRQGLERSADSSRKPSGSSFKGPERSAQHPHINDRWRIPFLGNTGMPIRARSWITIEAAQEPESKKESTT